MKCESEALLSPVCMRLRCDTEFCTRFEQDGKSNPHPRCPTNLTCAKFIDANMNRELRYAIWEAMGHDMPTTALQRASIEEAHR